MSGTIQVTMLTGAVLAWGAVAYKGLSLWRHPSDPAARAYWAGFLALALNMTLLMPPITGWIDGVTGVPSLTYLICDAAALFTCWVWLACLYQLNKPDHRAARAVCWFGMLVIAGLAYFSLRFIIAPGQVQHRLSGDIRGLYLASYRLLFVGIIAAHMAYFIVLLRRYAAEVHRPTLRLRLHFMMLAAGLVIGFSANESLRTLGVPSPEVIGALFLLAAVFAMVMGLTFSRRLDRALNAGRDYWLCFRLYPLWRALYPVNSGLSFLPTPDVRRRFFPLDSLKFVICRQVTEIRDWQIALRPFQRPGVAPPVHTRGARRGRCPDDAAAFSEAWHLVAALRSWHEARLVGESGDRERALSATDGHHRTPALGEADWREEARYLAKVAWHFIRLQRSYLDPPRPQVSQPQAHGH